MTGLPDTDLQTWLHGLGLQRYAELFAGEDIDFPTLLELGDQDLERLGITVGHRKKILSAIAAWRDRPLAVRDASESAERRQVSVMFCDLVGSTALSTRLDPEDYRVLIRSYQQACEEVIVEVGGYIAKYMGDGILVYFGYPKAHEDDAARAIRSALRIITAMERLNAENPDKSAAHLAVRIGIATGVVVVGDIIGQGKAQEVAIVGETPNLAARLQALANVNQIVLDALTQSLAKGSCQFEGLGKHRLKGFSEKVYAWTVVGEKLKEERFAVAIERGLLSLVGRDSELQKLQRCWRSASAGKLAVVHLVGEAGIGKSRLAYEFCTRLGADGGAYLSGQCGAIGSQSAFLPFVHILRLACQIHDQDDATTKRSSLRQILDSLGLSQAEHEPYLAHLLGFSTNKGLEQIDGQVIAARTRQAFLAFLRAQCRLAPLVLLIEDVHWLDSLSENLLDTLITGAADFPLLILCTLRPEYQPPWASRERVTTIVLKPLSPKDIAAIARHRVKQSTIPPALGELLADKAAGNPLFAEEIVSHLLQTGRLHIGKSGAVLQPGDGPVSSIPSTLAGLLLERVDDLDASKREVLKLASVIGPRFSADLLAEVTGLGDQVALHLSDLDNRCLIRPTRAGEYQFRHALLCEAVYETLLRVERATLHERVGLAMERLYTGRLEDVVDELAHHFSHTADVTRKLRYCVMAGGKHLRTYAINTAYDYFRQALDIMEAGTDGANQELLCDLVLNLMRLHYFDGDFAAIIRLSQRYLAVFEALDDASRLGRCLFEFGYSCIFAGRVEDGKPVLQRALRIGQKHNDSSAIGYAALGLAWSEFWQKPYAGQEAHVNERSALALTSGMRAGDMWLQSKALFFNLYFGLARGNPRLVRNVAGQLLEMGRISNDPRPRIMGLIGLAEADGAFGDLDTALARVEECLRLALSPFDRTLALAAKGRALAIAQRAEAIPALKEALAKLAAGQAQLPLASLESCYGAAVASSGAIARGVRDVEKCIRRHRAAGNHVAAAFDALILGEIYVGMALRTVKPPWRVVFKNLGFLVRTLPLAGRRARRYLESACEGFRGIGPAYHAWALANLGKLALARKHSSEAQAHFQEALRLADSVDAFAIIAKVQPLWQSLQM